MARETAVLFGHAVFPVVATTRLHDTVVVRIIYAVITEFQEFTAVGGGPHHFRPLHAYYTQQNNRLTDTFDGIYHTLFPCWRCDSSFETTLKLGSTTVYQSRCDIMRFHLAAASTNVLALEMGILPHRLVHGHSDLRISIFEHESSCFHEVPATTRASVRQRRILQNADLKLEIFSFLRRHEVDKCMRPGRDWHAFVASNSNRLPLHDVHATVNEYIDGAKLTVINRSVTDACYGRRVFNLQTNEDASSSALARNHLRNSCIQNMSIFPHGRQDVWIWASAMPFDLANCAVRRLSIHAGLIPAVQAADQRSFARLLSLEGVAVLKLDLTYPAFAELLRTGPLTCHPVFVEIRKLILRVSTTDSRPASPTTIDTSWIMSLLTLPKCKHVEVLIWKLRFTDDPDITSMRRIFREIAQMYVDSTTFRSLPDTFILDVRGENFAYDELPFVPFSERTLKTRFAAYPGAGTFNARIYPLTNSNAGLTFNVTTGLMAHQTPVHAFRMFKDTEF